jgi:hypothetical protein
MDGLVEELLRLEHAKNKALIQIDAPAYEEGVREQLQVLEAWKGTLQQVQNVERLLALSRLITLNVRLLQNLMATTPLFQLSGSAYTADGRAAAAPATRRVFVEA